MKEDNPFLKVVPLEVENDKALADYIRYLAGEFNTAVKKLASQGGVVMVNSDGVNPTLNLKIVKEI